MVIIVVSDTHLGYCNSNSKAFENFLDHLLQRDDVKILIILGDFIDMWRRDASGLFLEFNSILGKILSLTNKIEVRCVAGNHDYHLLKLTSDDNYPFNKEYHLKFEENLQLDIEGIKYMFMHGYEFDPSQWKPVMELLCENFSDEAGQIRSDIWRLLKLMRKDFVNFWLYLLKNHKGSYKSYVKNLKRPPNKRDNFNITGVEERALKYLKEKIPSVERLIFGHTHRPFVSATMNLANSGSWVNDEQTYNTYLEIDGKDIHLMQYSGVDITNKFRH